MTMNKILVGIFIVLLNIGFAGAATLNVGAGQAYTTIQSAIDAANIGDIISVGEGTYAENLVIKKDGISVIGKNKEKTIIDAKKTGSAIRIETNNVIISGFTVQNNGGSGKDDAGISIYKANNNTVVNSIIVNNSVGISLYTSSNNNIISGNYIKSSGRYGIFIYTSNDNKVYNNNIESNQIGIYADSTSTNHIYSNNFIDNKDQAYDNSGKNSWDEEKSGNYWSSSKGSDASVLLGGANARDNYPLSGAVSIKEVTIPLLSGLAEQKSQDTKAQADTGNGKSSPGFTASLVVASIIVAVALKNRKRV
jgi:parallel beta-helix repeat protein